MLPNELLRLLTIISIKIEFLAIPNSDRTSKPDSEKFLIRFAANRVKLTVNTIINDCYFLSAFLIAASSSGLTWLTH
jgi:hypothetical protein